MTAAADTIKRLERWANARERRNTPGGHGKEGTALLREAAAALGELEAALRQGLGAVPNEDGGPGKEETYWLRAKMQAATTHFSEPESFGRRCRWCGWEKLYVR